MLLRVDWVSVLYIFQITYGLVALKWSVLWCAKGTVYRDAVHSFGEKSSMHCISTFSLVFSQHEGMAVGAKRFDCGAWPIVSLCSGLFVSLMGIPRCVRIFGLPRAMYGKYESVLKCFLTRLDGGWILKWDFMFGWLTGKGRSYVFTSWLSWLF